MTMRSHLKYLFAAVFTAGAIFAIDGAAQKLGTVCGDPTLRCSHRENFQAFELPFDTGRNFVIAESLPFYAVILESVKLGPNDNCETAISEEKRVALQERFPRNKVFAFKCFEAAMNSYSGVADNMAFLAIYGGRTAAQARTFLAKVKGEYQGANVRRLRVVINGT